MTAIFVRIVGMAFSIVYFLLLAHVILGFIQSAKPYAKPSKIHEIVLLMTEPFLSPIRRFIRKFQSEGSMFAAVDFSPLVALLILQVVHRVILMIIY